MDHFRNKVAVVTGAGSGIGRALAIGLSQRGAHLAVSDVNEAGLAETMALLAPGTKACSYHLDVSKRDHVFSHADDVARDLGPAHFVFNNAGVTLLASINNATIEEIEWLLGINLWGVIYGTKAFLPSMLERNEGHIVNISSVFGIIAVPCQSAYHIAKFGVRGFTECLITELHGTGVKATTVHPGGIATAIAKAARIGSRIGPMEKALLSRKTTLLSTPPEDMARAILDGVARGDERVLYGNQARFLDRLQRLFPVRYRAILRALR